MAKRKQKLTRLQLAEGKFSQAYREHQAWGQKMVMARTELLEANAEERAQLAVKFPDDPLIQAKAKEATDEMLEWYKKIGAIREIHEKCANCGCGFNEVQRYSGVIYCLPCEEKIYPSNVDVDNLPP